ncbi:MAG: hypothetical protein R3F20_02225 [Planctomycetota bacterium]
MRRRQRVSVTVGLALLILVVVLGSVSVRREIARRDAAPEISPFCFLRVLIDRPIAFGGPSSSPGPFLLVIDTDEGTRYLRSVELDDGTEAVGFRREVWPSTARAWVCSESIGRHELEFDGTEERVVVLESPVILWPKAVRGDDDVLQLAVSHSDGSSRSERLEPVTFVRIDSSEGPFYSRIWSEPEYILRVMEVRDEVERFEPKRLGGEPGQSGPALSEPIELEPDEGGGRAAFPAGSVVEILRIDDEDRTTVVGHLRCEDPGDEIAVHPLAEDTRELAVHLPDEFDGVVTCRGFRYGEGYVQRLATRGRKGVARFELADRAYVKMMAVGRREGRIVLHATGYLNLNGSCEVDLRRTATTSFRLDLPAAVSKGEQGTRTVLGVSIERPWQRGYWQLFNGDSVWIALSDEERARGRVEVEAEAGLAFRSEFEIVLQDRAGREVSRERCRKR